MGRIVNLINQRFGKLVVLNKDPNQKGDGNTWWSCICDCGNMTSQATYRLNRKKNKASCGCYAKELNSIAHTKHGDFGSLFYKVWDSIKMKCQNPNHHSYPDYGGRGITVCDRWCDYKKFKEDMYESYLIHQKEHANTSIGRKDNNKGYYPENCRWETWTDQVNNRRNMKLFEATYIIPGQSFGYKETGTNQTYFGKKYGLHQQGISMCLRGVIPTYKGWEFRYV